MNFLLLGLALLQLNTVHPLDLINWKVGDTMTYTIDAGMLGKGSSVKSVTKDEGTAIWVRNEVKLAIQNEVQEMLINKADGKVLKLIRNGQETEVPNEQLEIISSDTTDITVPAGTFQCLHVVAKSQQVKQMEIWANPRDTAMDGMLKLSVDTGFFPLVFELTSFKRIP